MKYFLFFLILIPELVLSQNLTFSELIGMRTKTPGQVETFLTNKGWELISTERDDYDNITISYSFNRSTFENKASSFISYSYNPTTKQSEYWNKNIVDYQIHELHLYKKINTDLNALGYKEIDYIVKENRTEKHFKSGSGKTIAILTTSLQSQSNSIQSKGTIYTISLWPPDLYKYYPKENNKQVDILADEIDRLTEMIVDSLEIEEKNSLEKVIKVRDDIAILNQPNLRNAKVIGRIKNGKAILISKHPNGYLKIKSDGVTGYILETAMITW